MKWTEEELKLLKEQYPQCGSNIPALREKHSVNAIWKKAQILGIQKNILFKTCIKGEAEPPWYVTTDVTCYKDQHAKEWHEAEKRCNAIRDFMEHSKSKKGRTEYAEKLAREQLKRARRTLYQYIRTYQEATAWASLLEKQNGCNYDHLTVLALCRKPPESSTEWTEEELELLKEQYPKNGNNIPALRKTRTAAAINVKASSLRLKKQRWTAEELKLLKEQYPQYGAHIPALLGKHSDRSIYRKARMLNIKKN